MTSEEIDKRIGEAKPCTDSQFLVLLRAAHRGATYTILPWGWSKKVWDRRAE